MGGMTVEEPGGQATPETDALREAFAHVSLDDLPVVERFMATELRRMATLCRVPPELLRGEIPVTTTERAAEERVLRACLRALPPDTGAALLDLARAGHEADFRPRAASAGVPAPELDGVWIWTRAHVTTPAADPPAR